MRPTYKTLQTLKLISQYPKSYEELASRTGESIRHVKRRIAQGREWGAEIEYKKEHVKGTHGVTHYVFISNFEEISETFEFWLEIERRIDRQKKPFLAKGGKS